ncbi:MAG TPA: trigger factor [Candidatus Saccharimonadales bacterium]
MQVNKKNLSETKVQLTVTADAGQLAAAKQATLEHLANDVKLPGFRQGKAPLALVEKNVNPATLQSEFLDRAMNVLYGAVIDSEKLRPIAQPQVNITKFVPFETLELVFEVEVIGEIKLPDYKKIKKAKSEVKVTTKDVEAVIEQLQKREAERKDVDRAAKGGDQTYIDFKGVDAKTKEPIKGADGTNYPLVLGSDTFIPGFEDNIIGLKAGSEKTFTITFPKDYGVAALQNRKVEFTVTVQKVQELAVAKVDDAFAAKAGPFKTVQELKDDIKRQLVSEKQHQADRDYADALLTEIAAKSKVAIPEALIEEQVNSLLNEQKQNAIYRGMTWPDFLESLGFTEETYRKKILPDAELRVKAGLILGEVAEQEKIMITPEELEIRLQLLKAQYPDDKMQAELDKPETRREIVSRMVSEKTVDALVGYAGGAVVDKAKTRTAAKPKATAAKKSSK